MLAIALTANLVNLMDLRPGRALKFYSALVVVALVVLGFSWAWSIVPFFALIALGPVLAVWSFDLKERAMLGDAGANVFGVVAGWIMAIALSPWWWALTIYVVIVLIKNVASEKISFSAIVDKVRSAALVGRSRQVERKLAPHLKRMTARIGNGTDTVGTERELD